MSAEKKVLCSIDLPDQSASSLRIWGFVAVAVQVCVISAFVAYSLAKFDWEDAKDLDDHTLLSGNSPMKAMFGIIAGVGGVACIMSIVSLLINDRGWCLYSCILNVVTLNLANIFFPINNVAIFALAGVQVSCVCTAWVVYRVQEKFQEEIDAAGKAEKVESRCELPDMTISRFRVVISVSAFFMFGSAVAMIFLILETAAAYSKTALWYNGLICAVAALSVIPGTIYLHRTSLMMSTTFNLFALASLCFTLGGPLVAQWLQDKVCDSHGKLTSKQQDKCDSLLRLQNAYIAMYFTCMLFSSIVTWAVWRLSEALQASSIDADENLDVSLADSFNIGCWRVESPISFYRVWVYTSSVIVILLAVGFIVLLAQTDNKGMEEGFRKLHISIVVVMVLSAVISTLGAGTNDRGMLMFAFFLSILFMSNALLIVQRNGTSAKGTELARQTVAANQRWGAVLYVSPLNAFFAASNPMTKEQERRLNASFAIAVFTMVISLLNTGAMFLLSEALEDERKGAGNSREGSDGESYTGLTDVTSDEEAAASGSTSGSAGGASGSGSGSGSGATSGATSGAASGSASGAASGSASGGAEEGSAEEGEGSEGEGSEGEGSASA